MPGDALVVPCLVEGDGALTLQELLRPVFSAMNWTLVVFLTRSQPWPQLQQGAGVAGQKYHGSGEGEGRGR